MNKLIKRILSLVLSTMLLCAGAAFFGMGLQTGIGGLVYLSYGAEVVFGHKAPEADLLGGNLFQSGFNSQYGMDPGRVDVRSDIRLGNHPDYPFMGKNYRHSLTYGKLCGGRITRLPLQAEWEYKLYVALGLHYLRVPASAAAIMASLAVT